MTQVLIELQDDSGNTVLSKTQVPIEISRAHLLALTGKPISVNFYYNGNLIRNTLKEVLDSEDVKNYESVLVIKTCQDAMDKFSFNCSESFSGHEAPILCVATDGDVIVTGGGDFTVRFWCALTKTQKKVCKNHTHWVQKICFAEEAVASGCMEGKIIIYNRNGDFLRNIDAHKSSITCLKYKDCLISGGRDNYVKFWKLSGECIFSYSHAAPITDLALSGNFVISVARDKKLKVFEKFEYSKDLEEHRQAINCMDVWNNYIVTGGDDGLVCVWKDFILTRKIDHKKEVISVSISRNGSFFTSGSFDKSVKIISLENGTIMFTYNHLNHVYRVISMNDIVISCSKDKTIKIFGVTQGEILNTLVCGDEVYCFEYNNERLIAGSKDKKLYFFC